MDRITMDFGIDLGTTNSTIAVLKGTTQEVFKNNINSELTPSVFWIDSKNIIHIGEQAKNRLYEDEGNAYAEFKASMGTDYIYTFARSGKKMKPEELSAEVLKSLRGDVQSQTGEEVIAAAIGVPAMFTLAQCEATDRAAQLAGFRYHPLIQEPTAAAIAYGFQDESRNVFWMVYDFGGGTFDAAIMQVQDGRIELINHGGDNQLGGKLIDWAIVEQILAPAVRKELGISDFKRGNKKWDAALGKLKSHAEEAKIRLSRVNTAPVIVDSLFEDKGKSVRFEYDLKRSDVEHLIEPLVERSINVCKKVIEEKKLTPGNIEKMILVGGPTLTPILRSMLSSALNVPLISDIDPLTVVARGAAIFAGTQVLSDKVRSSKKLKGEEFVLEWLSYEPIGHEPSPDIAGKIISPNQKSLNGFNIEFIESKSAWSSGIVALKENGIFKITIHADKDRENEFKILLRDSHGTICRTSPERFTYIIGATLSKPILTDSIGVAQANNEMAVFLEKGKQLPNHRKISLLTIVALKAGDAKSCIRIPLVEGDNIRRADRNPVIGFIEIYGSDVHRDLPVGSEIEITIEADESRLIKAKAYITLLEKEISAKWAPGEQHSELKVLNENFKKEKAHLEEVRRKANEAAIGETPEPLEKIEKERTIADIEGLLQAGKGDNDAARQAQRNCEKRICALGNAIDEANDALELPTLISNTNTLIEDTRKIVNSYGNADSKRVFGSIEVSIRQAIEMNDSDLLHKKIDELGRLHTSILVEQPGWWVGYFEYLAEKRSHMRDQNLADNIIAQGRHAQDLNDLQGLRAAVIQLINLLPQEEAEQARGYGSTVLRMNG